jgi:hypothetical protein
MKYKLINPKTGRITQMTYTAYAVAYEIQKSIYAVAYEIQKKIDILAEQSEIKWNDNCS